MITKFIKIVIIFANIGFSQAQYTTIPDANFEQELINQGIDSESTLDGQVLTSDINTITNLLSEVLILIICQVLKGLLL